MGRLYGWECPKCGDRKDTFDDVRPQCLQCGVDLLTGPTMETQMTVEQRIEDLSERVRSLECRNLSLQGAGEEIHGWR